MAQPSHPKHLLHFVAESISTFTHGKTFEEFSADVLLRLGVERQFENLGKTLT